jgi:hypothetical protein
MPITPSISVAPGLHNVLIFVTYMFMCADRCHLPPSLHNLVSRVGPGLYQQSGTFLTTLLAES